MATVSADHSQCVVFESVLRRKDGSIRLTHKEEEHNGMRILCDIQYFMPDGTDVSEDPAMAYLDVPEEERNQMVFLKRSAAQAKYQELTAPSVASDGTAPE